MTTRAVLWYDETLDEATTVTWPVEGESCVTLTLAVLDPTASEYPVLAKSLFRASCISASSTPLITTAWARWACRYPCEELRNELARNAIDMPISTMIPPIKRTVVSAACAREARFRSRRELFLRERTFDM